MISSLQEDIIDSNVQCLKDETMGFSHLESSHKIMYVGIIWVDFSCFPTSTD